MSGRGGTFHAQIPPQCQRKICKRSRLASATPSPLAEIAARQRKTMQGRSWHCRQALVQNVFPFLLIKVKLLAQKQGLAPNCNSILRQSFFRFLNNVARRKYTGTKRIFYKALSTATSSSSSSSSKDQDVQITLPSVTVAKLIAAVD